MIRIRNSFFDRAEISESEDLGTIVFTLYFSFFRKAVSSVLTFSSMRNLRVGVDDDIVLLSKSTRVL